MNGYKFPKWRAPRSFKYVFEVFLNNENSEATGQNTNSSENFPMIALWTGRQALNVKTQDLNSSTPALPRARTSKLKRSVSVLLIQNQQKFNSQTERAIHSSVPDLSLATNAQEEVTRYYLPLEQISSTLKIKEFEICSSDSPPPNLWEGTSGKITAGILL